MPRPKTTPRERHRRDTRATPDVPGILPTKVYTTQEAASLLRRGVQTIRQEVRAGRLRKTGGDGHWTFQGQWLLDWLAGQGLASARAPQTIPASEE